MLARKQRSPSLSSVYKAGRVLFAPRPATLCPYIASVRGFLKPETFTDAVAETNSGG